MEIEPGFPRVGQEGTEFEAAFGHDGHFVDRPFEHFAAHAAGKDILARRGPVAEEADLLGPHRDEHLAAGSDAFALFDPKFQATFEAAINEPVFALQHLGFDNVGLADEAGHEFGARVVVDFRGRADLLDLAFVHHRDAVGHTQGLLLVVGDKNKGDAEAFLQVFQLGAHLRAQLGIEGGERFVEQKNLRFANNGPRQSDALALSAGQLRRLAVLHALQGGHAHRPLGLLANGLGRHFFHPQTEGDILAHREVGKKSIALEDLIDVPLVRRVRGDVLAGNEDLPAGRLLEAADQAEAGRLAAAGRTEKSHEFAFGDVEADAVEGDEIIEPFGHIADFDHRIHGVRYF